MDQNITYQTCLAGIDWQQLKATLAADHFDNGRSPEQLRASFENSFSCVLAYCEDAVVGTARALSDGVCNAYVVDVWTHSGFRRRGIGRTMMRIVLSGLPGQHVYLFSDDASEVLYEARFCRAASRARTHRRHMAQPGSRELRTDNPPSIVRRASLPDLI